MVDSRRDDELLSDHLAGRAGAFDVLVARYATELFAFLYRFVGSRAAADDLVQETFLQVHMSAATYDRARAFKPWLYTISANKARDYLRFRGRRQELSLEPGGSDPEGPSAAQSLEAGGMDVADEVAAGEQREAVRRVIDELSPHLREILLLGYYQQLPYAEIAEILEIPVGTVKSRLHAAVTQFAKLWRGRAPAGLDEGRGRTTWERAEK